MVNILEMPQKILYGAGSLEKAGEIISKYGKSALIISDEMMSKLGHVEKLTKILNSEGIEVNSYLGVNSEPTHYHVLEALELQKNLDCNVIISIGGGSPIDVAKAVSVISTNGGSIDQYYRKEIEITSAGIPHIAIPTTAGTGSEVTNVTVITDAEKDIKMMIKDSVFLPKASIVDAQLTMSAPKHVTAATGLDALCHALESYLSLKSHAATKVFSVAAIKEIAQNLKTVYFEGNNVEARNKMSLGSMYAGIAFSNASVTLIHGMSRPIGALFHVPHGISNAMLLPAVLEYTKNSMTDLLAEISDYLNPSETFKTESNEEKSQYTIDYIKSLCKELEIPNLRGWGIPEEEFNASLDKMATDAINSGSPGNHPAILGHDEIVELYKICYDYKY